MPFVDITGQMPESDDHQLLSEFVRDRSETAFTELVRRYAGLVHSTAFRFCGNPHHAEEITQSVFVILARKAETLSPRVVVSGWLYQTARLTAANFVKGEMRRCRREQEAVMQSDLLETDSTAWGKIAPLLDDAMGVLGETERNAVLLRYFENRTSSEIGAALRMNEETARKRVNRALEKLRHFFAERGVMVSSAALSSAISANSVQPISAFMVKSISAVALAKGAAASTSTLTLIKGALKIMAWTKAKTAIAAVALAVLGAGTTAPIIIHHYRASESVFTSTTELTDTDNMNYQRQTGTTPVEVARTFLAACSQGDWTTADKYWQTDPRNKNSVASFPDSFKQGYGGLEIVSLGKPFKARISIAKLIAMQPSLRNQFKSTTGDFEAASVFVPYEIRFKNGEVKKWQLSIRCDNPEHRWHYDGGM